jgi:PAS domain S-box-containing protein
MAPTVTVRQKELVQSTWRQVMPISKTAPKLFYGRLFELDPQIRALFPADERSMKAQHLKLMQMIHICVRGLDQLDRIVPAVQSLGRRHVGYGVRNGDYDTVGAALLWTLEQGLGDAFDDEVKEAWTNVYGVLAAAMMGAADEAPQRSGYATSTEEDGSMETAQRTGYARPDVDSMEGPDGNVGRRRDAQVWEGDAGQPVEATQAISPALYGTGVVDRVSCQIGQVDLLQTGLNVLARVNGNGAIDEVNEGMEIVTGVPREELLGTDAFSYFVGPDRAKGSFMEALKGSRVRDKEVEVMHREGETTPLTYNVIPTDDGRAGVLLCRYQEG